MLRSGLPRRLVDYTATKYRAIYRIYPRAGSEHLYRQKRTEAYKACESVSFPKQRRARIAAPTAGDQIGSKPNSPTIPVPPRDEPTDAAAAA